MLREATRLPHLARQQCLGSGQVCGLNPGACSQQKPQRDLQPRWGQCLGQLCHMLTRLCRRWFTVLDRLFYGAVAIHDRFESQELHDQLGDGQRFGSCGAP